jgi:hypothetical protein
MGKGREKEKGRRATPEGMAVVCPTRLRTPRKAILEDSCPPQARGRSS